MQSGNQNFRFALITSRRGRQKDLKLVLHRLVEVAGEKEPLRRDQI
jgi:hypothetical protein